MGEWERDSSLLGWDHFYPINCYRNIYPRRSLSSSHDVFMCSGCVHTLDQWWREEGDRSTVVFMSVQGGLMSGGGLQGVWFRGICRKWSAEGGVTTIRTSARIRFGAQP